MTKKRVDAREGLMKFLKTWLWSIAYDPDFVAAKKNKTTGNTAVAKVDRALAQHFMDLMPDLCMAKKIFCAVQQVENQSAMHPCTLSMSAHEGPLLFTSRLGDSFA